MTPSVLPLVAGVEGVDVAATLREAKVDVVVCYLPVGSEDAAKFYGDAPANLEYKLEVWDSPNSAGVIIDAVRAAKIAPDRGIGGPLLSASSYFMKSPPEQYVDDVAWAKVEDFIAGNTER